MLEHTDAYILKCLDLGILCQDNIRQYPLRPFSLVLVLKLYALSARLPYEVNHTRLDKITQQAYYLTDSGLSWLYENLRQYPLPFLRSHFGNLFSTATEEDLKHLDQYSRLANFRGTTGARPKAGTKQAAMLVRFVGRCRREYKYDSLRAARCDLINLSRFYSLQEFKLYRLSCNGCYTEVPLVLKPNKRGVIDNLRRKDT